ncbi:hypothetical protein K1719_014778 [Acacia pycnantha]|nr:hypothetical protein K1719_014778 [Acacia pycnantha]
MTAHNWLSTKDGYGRKAFQSSTKSHSGASLKPHILRQPYIQRTVLNMASAAESIEKKLARMIANLNEEIANLNEGTANLYKRIRVIKQDTSALKEFINKEVLVQGNWPGGSSGRPVTANALGTSVVGAEKKTDLKGQKYVRELFSRRKKATHLLARESSPMQTRSGSHLLELGVQIQRRTVAVFRDRKIQEA